MDHRLLAWARAVKRRRRNKLPVLWLFSDSARLPDPLALLPSLPKQICGVVLRHGDAAYATRLALACRALGIALVLGNGVILPAHLRAGHHLRDGWRARPPGPPGLVTSSAHGIASLRRAARAGANIIFLSPSFATASHPSTRPLGVRRWNRLARQVPHPAIHALGGIDGLTIRALAHAAKGAGGIGIFLD